MVRLNLSLTRREFCATVAGAITESCEKSTVTIQRADLRHPFFPLSLFFSLSSRSLRPFTSRFPVYRRHVTSGQGWKGGRGVTHLSITSIVLISRRFEPSSDKKAKVQVYICICTGCRDPSCQICLINMCVYRTGRIVALLKFLG